MTPAQLDALLAEVAAGTLSIADAAARLKNLPSEDLGFARIDHDRELRQGFAEVIYGAGKTPAQVAGIARSLLGAGSNVLVTRTDEATHAAVVGIDARASWDPLARTITIVERAPPALGVVGVLCAGTSDLPVAEEAAVSAAFLGAEVVRLTDVGVAGLHRLLRHHEDLDRLDVAIVVAGMEGALPSVVGGLVGVPIVAVPTSVGYGASFHGIAALLGMLNSCAAGVTVVNIDNGFGAAAAAARMLRTRSTRHRA